MENTLKIFSCIGMFPVNQDTFFDLGYLLSHIIKTPQIKYFRSIDELRLERTEAVSIQKTHLFNPTSQ
jgi:hypothetical protein